MKKNVLITGVSGFIGSETALELKKSGFEVFGTSRKSFRFSEALNSLLGEISFFEADLTDYSAMVNMVREVMPDYVIHTGAITPVSYSFDHPWEVTNVNYLGTVNLAEALRKYVPNLKKFIFCSSMETYGHQPVHMERFTPFTEETPQNAGCPYAVAKIAAEQYLRYMNYAYDFPSISLRQTNCYGRKYNDYFVVEAFVTEMLKNNAVVNFGNPKPVRNFIYIDDLVDLYKYLLSDDSMVDPVALTGRSFCTGPDNGITIRQLAHYIKEKLDWKGTINWYTREQRAGEIFYLNSTNKLLYDLIGWKPKISLSEGLDKTICFWKRKLGVD